MATDNSSDSAEPQCLLHFDFRDVNWLQESSSWEATDYTSNKTFVKTGTLEDRSGRGCTGDVLDMKPHGVPREGLNLGGPSATGKYRTDNGISATLGCVQFSPVEFGSFAVSASLVVSYFKMPQDEVCLLYMGDGWDNHFTLKHYRPANRFMFEVCPEGNGWQRRVSVRSSASIEVNKDKVYHIVAVLTVEGCLKLFVNGQLDAESPGMAKNEFTVSRCRSQNYVGRWMRPDQSWPLEAGVRQLQLYDGELSPEAVAALHSRMTAPVVLTMHVKEVNAEGLTPLTFTLPSGKEIPQWEVNARQILLGKVRSTCEVEFLRLRDRTVQLVLPDGLLLKEEDDARLLYDVLYASD